MSTPTTPVQPLYHSELDAMLAASPLPETITPADPRHTEKSNFA